MSYKGFNRVELKRPQRSTFDLSEDKRLTMQMGYLYPIMYKECLPSDSFHGDTDCLVRLAPMLAPIYDQVQVFIHYFFVPYRLLWDEWETFITGGRLGPNDPDVGPPPVVPEINIGDILTAEAEVLTKSHLADYLGVPMFADLPNAPDPVDWSNAWIDVLPFMAYQQIWMDYYRDRNFVEDDILDPFSTPIISGQIATADVPDFINKCMTLRPRAYKHDYFTSALPFPQRGAEVMIPSQVTYLNRTKLKEQNGTTNMMDGNLQTNIGELTVSTNPTVFGQVQNIESVGPLVEDWRTAYSLQVWLERNAVGGSRYNESIQAHFGVRPQDERLQRAEYIGGGMLPIKINEVVSTAWAENAENAPVPQANMAGRGIGYGNTRGFNWFCPEHGCIIGMMSIVNPPSYHQGLPRYFKRRTFLDYPFPTFAKLGEQEVFDYEIYAASVNLAEPAAGETYPVFGYQSRYAEWKTGRNTSHGDFHDDFMFWSLTFDFGITPILSRQFVEFDPNIEERIFAAPTQDNFWVYLHNKVMVKRPLPYFGTPNTLGFE